VDVHVYFHSDSDTVATLATIVEQGKQIMATAAEVLALENANKQLFTDYITKRDAVDADLLAQIKALTGTAGGVATQAQIDELFALASAEKALFTPVVVPPPDPNPVPPPEPAQPK
jgi:hypothetical protein